MGGSNEMKIKGLRDYGSLASCAAERRRGNQDTFLTHAVNSLTRKKLAERSGQNDVKDGHKRSCLLRFL